MRLRALLALMLAGCQTYDFEPVEPFSIGQTTDKQVIVSRRLKPNVMLLVDNSGSMLLPTDPSVASCTLNGTLCGAATPCPASCPTRSSELKSAMSTFLSSSGTLARLGLTVFPTPNGSANGLLGCDASSELAVHLPAPTPADEGTDPALTVTAQQIATAISGLAPLGGTPTAGSLQFLSTYAGLGQEDFREDFVLLLTDGLPNCNGANPNAVCSSPTAACECTTLSCSGTDPVRNTCSKGCLDRDATVEQVKALRLRGIRTIVVGFGADLATGSGPTVLDAMAREGGFPRGCAAGAVCEHSYFQARDGAELTAALKMITDGLEHICDFVLTARPSDPRLISVMVDGQFVPPGTTYDYDFANNKVTFLGAMCERLQASTPQHPVSVEFRIVERF